MVEPGNLKETEEEDGGSPGEFLTLAAAEETLRELREILASPSATGDRVSALIFQDPAIAIAICQHTYSVQQGIGDPFSFSNPWQMIMRLGVEHALDIINTVAQRPQPANLIFEAYSAQRRYASRISEYCRAIARNVNPQYADLAALLGLLGGIGPMLGVLTHRERFVLLLEQTPNHAKANYRMLKEFNFDLEVVTRKFLRRNGIPEKFLSTIQRDGRSPGTQQQADLRSVYLSAVEVCNAFDEGRTQQYAPARPLPANSSLRLLQLRETVYQRLYEELLEITRLSLGLEEEAKPEQASMAEQAAPATTAPVATAPATESVTESVKQSPTDGDLPDLAELDSELDAGAELAADSKQDSHPDEGDLNFTSVSAGDDSQPLIDLVVQPIGNLVPSAARVRRIQRLRTNIAALEATSAVKKRSFGSLGIDDSAADRGLEFAGDAVSTLIRENPMISGAVRGIRNIEALFGKGHLGKARDLTVAILQPITDVASRYQAALYFAAKAYYPHLMEGRQKITLAEAIAMLLPSEASAVVALTYLGRQVAPNCGERGWRQLGKLFRVHSEIGRFVGSAVPESNAGHGMLIAGVRYMASGALLAKFGERFEQYMDEMRTAHKLWDCAVERSRFGTSHLELAAVILQRLGFGVRLAGEFLPGAFSSSSTVSVQMLNWIESIQLSGSPFTAREAAPALGVQRADLIVLRDKCQALLALETPLNWFERDKTDLVLDGKCRVPSKKQGKAGGAKG